MKAAGASRAVVTLLLVSLVSAFGLAACGSDPVTGPDQAGPASVQAASGSTRYPVQVANCGRTLHFDQAPQRIVSGWTTSTELLIELGLADRIVGQYNTSSGVPVARYAAIEQAIPVLSESAPTREALLAARPDLIWADGGYLFDGQQLPTIEDLDAAGIQVMILSGFCTDDASKATVRDVATDLATLGTIFGIRGEADRVQAGIDDRLGRVASRLAGKDPVPVAVISSFQGTVYAYDGVYSDIARLAGATNSYAGTLPAGRYYHEISVEDLTRQDPDTMVYLLGGSESEATAREYLSSRFPTVAAVRSNRVIYLPQTDSTNLGGVDGVEKLAAALHP